MHRCLALITLVGCLDSGSTCSLGEPNSVCFVADDGTTVDHSDTVAAATVAEPASLSLGSGVLTFGPGTFRVKVAVEGNLVIAGAGAVSTVLAGPRAERPTELYGSVVRLAGETSSVEVLDVTIEDGVALSGGGITSDGVAQSVTVRRAKFRDNLANGSNTWGGAIYAAGTLVVEDAEFHRNYGYQGGAIYAGGPSTRIADSRFTENDANEGGAVFAYTDALELRGGELAYNTASDAAGLYLAGPGTATITETVLRNNAASSSAGGILLYTGTATLTRVGVIGSAAPRAAGMLVVDGRATVTGSRFLGNQSFSAYDDGIGGGVLLDDGELVATNTDFGGNRADVAGGAIALTRRGGGSTFVAEGCYFQSNEGPGPGAPAVANLQLDGSTFAPADNAHFRCDPTGCR